MEVFHPGLLGSGTLLYLANLAIASCLVSAAGLAAVRACRNGPAPVHHGLLVATLLLLLSTPLLLSLAGALGWGGIPVPVPATADRAGPVPAHPALPPQENRTTHTAPPGATPAGGVSAALPATGTLLACIWAAGVAVLAVRLVRGLYALTRLCDALQAVRAPVLEQAAEEACQALGVGRRVAVYQTPLALTPFSLGLVSPRIVLPEHLPAHLDDEEMRYVLLHEVAHLRRRDHWVALLQLGCAALFWWNPLLRVVNAHLARLREQICDDHVVSAGGKGRRFAEVLLRVAQWGASLPPATCSAALLDENADDLTERVRRLLKKKQPRALEMSRGSRAVVVLFGLLLGVLLFGTGLRAANAPVPAPRPGPRAKAGPNGPNQGVQGLGGKWRMHLPRGFQHEVTLTPAGPNRYRLDPRKLNSSGVYEMRGNRLVIVEPNDRRLLGFEWEFKGGKFVLVGQPPIGKTGSNYLGATLTRAVQ